MSRYEVLHNDKGLSFGYDNSCGEFLMIWIRPADMKERKMQDQFGPNPEEMLVDLDTKFDKHFNRDEMLKLIDLHGFQLSEFKTAKDRGR